MEQHMALSNFIGKYIVLGEFACEIVESTLGKSNYISLQTVSGKYLRHSNSIVKESGYIDNELFKYDSSFLLVEEEGQCTLYCSNEGLQNFCIAYKDQLIISRKNDIASMMSKFTVIDSSNTKVLLSCLNQMSILEKRLDKLISRFELHHPITNTPKTFGKLRMFQEAGIELLKIFDEICRKHNLKYWMDYGTLLGAVRHKGYIPWDDDLDVCMMSDDFYKFQEIIDEELVGLNIKYTHNFHPFIYKLECITPNGSGAWLDIFPFYYQKEDVKLEDYIDDFRKTRVERGRVSKDANKVRGLALLFNDKYDAKHKTSQIFRGFQAADHPLCDVRSYEEVFPLVELEFEGLSLFAPNRYLEKLEKQYGNFWQYPDSFLAHRKWD